MFDLVTKFKPRFIIKVISLALIYTLVNYGFLSIKAVLQNYYQLTYRLHNKKLVVLIFI